jgi:hypothetical protein
MSNEIVKTLLNYDYGNKRLNRYRFISRRSKNKRILNKAFGFLLWAYMEQNQVAVFGEIVIIKKRHLLELEGFIDEQN